MYSGYGDYDDSDCSGHSDEGMYDPLEYNDYAPAKNEKPMYSKDDLADSLEEAKELFLSKMDSALDEDDELNWFDRRWYFRNSVYWEIEQWSRYTDEKVAKAARSVMRKGHWMPNTRRMKAQEMPVYTRTKLKIKVSKMLSTIVEQAQNVKWEIPVPAAQLGSRPIITCGTLLGVHQQWKGAVMELCEKLANGVALDPSEVRKGRRDLRKEEHFYISNYPDLSIDADGKISSFPKKEVPGSGLKLARKLKIHTTKENVLPSKYGSKKPRIGDTPQGFPSHINKLTSEHIFWLVVFYNDAFALEFPNDLHPRECLFEVWWHLSIMAKNDGDPPTGSQWDVLKEERMWYDEEHGWDHEDGEPSD